MQLCWLDNNDTYDGTQLSELYAYRNFSRLGDSLVAWCGPCKVGFDHMLDVEDIIAQSPIAADNMLHLIVELFEWDLKSTIGFQRLISAHLAELTTQICREKNHDWTIERRGDDVYVDNRKFNVSIATVSRVSSMIHFGINIDSKGTPVPTFCIEELNVPVDDFYKNLSHRIQTEFQGINKARRKVLPVR